MNETNEHNPNIESEVAKFVGKALSDAVDERDARIAELERRVEELTEENEDLQQFKSEVDAEGSVPASRVQLLSNYEHAFRDIGLLLGFDTADTEGTSPEEIAERVSAELSQLRAEVERLTKERDEAKRHLEMEQFGFRMMCSLTESIAKLVGVDTEKAEPPDVLGGVRRLRAQLAEREEDRWQPIETAPKDGHFLGFIKWGEGIEECSFVCAYSGHYKRFVIVCAETLRCEITHWQPLPKPPAIRAARAQEDGK